MASATGTTSDLVVPLHALILRHFLERDGSCRFPDACRIFGEKAMIPNSVQRLSLMAYEEVILRAEQEIAVRR